MILNISDELFFACVLAITGVFSVFFAIIVAIRSRKSALNTCEKDFIDKFFDKQKNFVSSIPGGMKYQTYIILSFLLPVIAVTAIYVITGNGFIASLGILGIFLPRIILIAQKDKIKKQFEERYARALRQISSSLRAGMSIEQALDDLCKNPFIHDTVKNEFIQINSDVKVGIPITEAFKKSAERLNTTDSKDVAAAIMIQNEVGGNEAKTIESISNNISNRIMLRKEINTLYAGAKATTLVMSILPFGMLIYMFTSVKDITDYYFEGPLNILILVGIVALMIVGIFVMQKMLKNGKKGVL